MSFIPKKPRRKPVQYERKLMMSMIQYLNLKGVFSWITYQPLLRPGQFKMYHHSSTGVADILGIYQGRPLAIEVKHGSRPLSPGQVSFLEKFIRSGGLAFVARSLEDIDKNLFNKIGEIK